MSNVAIRAVLQSDIPSLVSLTSNSPTEENEMTSFFEEELKLISEKPDQRLLLVAHIDKQLIGLAGGRHYLPKSDPKPYETQDSLPKGWYLKGIKVHPNYWRSGIATKLTELRLQWLKERAQSAYVFLSKENKETIPMYLKFGFKEISRGWKFMDPSRIERGILFRLDF